MNHYQLRAIALQSILETCAKWQEVDGPRFRPSYKATEIARLADCIATAAMEALHGVRMAASGADVPSNAVTFSALWRSILITALRTCGERMNVWTMTKHQVEDLVSATVTAALELELEG